MKGGIYNILKARFLINEDANRNWRFIVFIIILAILMIAIRLLVEFVLTGCHLKPLAKIDVIFKKNWFSLFLGTLLD